MGKSIRVKVNRGGAREILNSAEVQADLLRRAETIQAAAGPDYVADVQPGRSRAHAMVKTAGVAGVIDNARNNTLLRNLGRGSS